MIWEDIKKQMVGAIVGAVVTGAAMMFTVTAKIDSLNTSFTQYQQYNNDRYSDFKESLSEIKQELKTLKAQTK
jgi:gas vesicle protein